MNLKKERSESKISANDKKFKKKTHSLVPQIPKKRNDSLLNEGMILILNLVFRCQTKHKNCR